MEIKDYAFIKPANWTREEERLLYEYVMTHGIVNNCIDWSHISEVFPKRTLAQCSSKLFRMRQETEKYNFKRDIRKIKKTQQEEQLRKVKEQEKISIEILIEALLNIEK